MLDVPLETQGCSLRWFRGTRPDFAQPPLSEHYVVLHLGGAKRVRRACDGPTLVRETSCESITVIPSGSGYSWSTQGPIEYAHLYIPPVRLCRLAETAFDRDGAQVRLSPEVGVEDPLLAALFQTLLHGCRADRLSPLALEVITESFLAQVLRGHSNVAAGLRPAQHVLPPRRLAEIKDYVETHLDRDLSLDTLSDLAHLSRFHFLRAFTKATGQTPHAFVMARRLDRAKRLLLETDLPISAIAQSAGFSGASHLSRRLFEAEGARPSTFRFQGVRRRG